MLIGLRNPGFNNRVKVPGYGSVNFGPNGENLLEVEDADGKNIVTIYKRTFVAINLVWIKGVKTAGAAPPVEAPATEIVIEGEGTEAAKPVNGQRGRGRRKGR